MKKQKNLAFLLAPILILTISWVILNVYHSYVNSTIDLPLAEDIKPIEGSFDTKTIEEIKSRKRVNPTNDIILENTDITNESDTATSSAQLNNDEDTVSTQSADIEP